MRSKPSKERPGTVKSLNKVQARNFKHITTEKRNELAKEKMIPELLVNLIYGCKSFHSHFCRSLKRIENRSAGDKGRDETLKA